MPSGITADIYEGKDVTVHQYMERVARSMTDFIHQRDDYHSPLTRRDVASSYKKYLDEAEQALEDFKKLNDDELRMLFEQERAEYVDRKNRNIEENKALALRYEKMIDQVLDLDFPQELAYAREYAIEYLQESYDFDVHDYEDDSIDKMVDIYIDENFDQWKSDRYRRLTKNVSHYSQEYAEHLKRDTEFNAKIDLWSTLVGYEIKNLGENE